MAQRREVGLLAFVAVTILNIILGGITLLATAQFDWSRINTDGWVLTLVTEILIIEVESILFPAYAVWRERRFILKGASAVLSRGDKLKNEAKKCIYGVWCYSGYNYDELANYFRKEKELIKKGVEVHRLVNIELVGKANARKHCEDFKDEIIGGHYILTSVKYHSREFLIVDHKKALILYQDLCAKDVGGGIGPHDEPYWVASYDNEYEELEKSGNRLTMDSSNWQQRIDEWIDLALAKK